MAKNTYGTGSFVLMNVGPDCPPPADGLLTSVAWTLADGSATYALEGAIFVTGAAVQWLRDGLGIVAAADEVGPLAESVPDRMVRREERRDLRTLRAAQLPRPFVRVRRDGFR